MCRKQQHGNLFQPKKNELFSESIYANEWVAWSWWVAEKQISQVLYNKSKAEFKDWHE